MRGVFSTHDFHGRTPTVFITKIRLQFSSKYGTCPPFLLWTKYILARKWQKSIWCTQALLNLIRVPRFYPQSLKLHNSPTANASYNLVSRKTAGSLMPPKPKRWLCRESVRHRKYCILVLRETASSFSQSSKGFPCMHKIRAHLVHV